MLIRNKDLKALNAVYESQEENKDFFNEYGFESCETYSMDYSTLCFFYTRFKVFREYYNKNIEDTTNLIPRIDEIIKELENEIKNFNTLGDFKSFKELLHKIVEILPECWW